MRDYRLRAAAVAGPLLLAIVPAAGSGRSAFAIALAGIAMGGVVLVAVLENLRLLREPPSIAAAKEAGVANATLMAIVYGWGSAAIAGMYYLTDLSWYHAYQYALYLAVPAALSALYARRIEAIDVRGRERPLRTGRALAAVQLVATLGIAALLVASGKAPGTRPDWAANTVFLTGSIALAAISLLALLAQRRLRPPA